MYEAKKFILETTIASQLMIHLSTVTGLHRMEVETGDYFAILFKILCQGMLKFISIITWIASIQNPFCATSEIPLYETMIVF